METLIKIQQYLNKALAVIAGCFLGAMICITCANIVLRIVWMPLRGTFELMGFFGAIVTAFALGYAQAERTHIAVDILVLRFSERIRKILNGTNYLVCTIFFIIVSWRIAQHATNLWNTGELTETLRFPYFPFTYGVALGCFVLALVLFVDFLKLFFHAKEKSA